MNQYKVAKNIESEPLIIGLKPNYYYIVFAILIVGLLLIAPFLLRSLKDPEHKGGGTILMLVLIWAISLFVSFTQFRKKSKRAKYKFSKKRQVLSNRDLYNQL